MCNAAGKVHVVRKVESGSAATTPVGRSSELTGHRSSPPGIRRAKVMPANTYNSATLVTQYRLQRHLVNVNTTAPPVTAQ